MSSYEKKQCPIRLYPDNYDRIKIKVAQDQITFQKLGEIVFDAYLKNNKEIMRLVRKYADEKNSSKRRYTYTDLEADEILRQIEKNSPLAMIEQAQKELDDEE